MWKKREEEKGEEDGENNMREGREGGRSKQEYEGKEDGDEKQRVVRKR